MDAKIERPKRKMNEVLADANSLMDILLECEGDISEQQEVYDELLGEIHADRDNAVNRMCWVIKKLTERSEGLKENAKELKELADKTEREAERLKTYLLETCIKYDWQKIKTDNFNVSVCNAGGNQSLRYIDSKTGMETKEYALLPEELREEIITYKPKTEQLRELLKEADHIEFEESKIEVQLLPRGKYLKF